MDNEKIKTIYEDENLLVIDKFPGIIVFPENERDKKKETLIDLLLKEFPSLKNVGDPPRYGIIHRLDKDTSGVLLVAKNNQSLEFFQNQFFLSSRNSYSEGKEKEGLIKRYLALVIGRLKENEGKIETLMGRSPNDPRKQKVYLPCDPDSKNKRKAITCFKVLKNFEKYSLIEVTIKTGRKHQIRTHLSYLGHPIAGDKIYGFKSQPIPKMLKRQFLHSGYLKIRMPDGEKKEFFSELPQDLKKVLESIKYSIK